MLVCISRFVFCISSASNVWLGWELCWEPRVLTRTLGEVLFLSRKPLVCTLLGTLSVHQLVENSDFSFALDNEALWRLFIRQGVCERVKQAGIPKRWRGRSWLYRSAVSTPIFASKELLKSLTTFDKFQGFYGILMTDFFCEIICRTIRQAGSWRIDTSPPSSRESSITPAQVVWYLRLA